MSGNAAFAERAEAAIHYEQIIMFGILAVSILLTTLNLGLFKNDRDARALITPPSPPAG